MPVAVLPADICGASARAPAHAERERCVEAADSRRDSGEDREGVGGATEDSTVDRNQDTGAVCSTKLNSFCA